METVIKIRPAQLLLSWQFDPQKQYPFAVEESFKESCGLVPDYFERAISVCEVVNIEEVALIMDDLYGYGGFAAYPLKGELKANGIYSSEFEDGDDLPAYVALTSVDPARCDVECFIYPYGIVGLRDSSGKTKVARFD
tara:strand:+ start:2231 stop:2644 length:414 start_codon:yes stop_codon:yes gene_type:complete